MMWFMHPYNERNAGRGKDSKVKAYCMQDVQKRLYKGPWKVAPPCCSCCYNSLHKLVRKLALLCAVKILLESPPVVLHNTIYPVNWAETVLSAR